MRHSLLFPGIVFLLFAADLFAQTNPDAVKESVRRILTDSGVHPVRGKDRVIASDKANKLGLEMVLGLSKAHTMAIISHFDYDIVRNHEEYPYIKDVIKVAKLKRWDFPIDLYIFVDSSDQVCRLNYKISNETGMTPEEATSILSQLKRDRAGLNVLRETDWEIAGWEESDRSYFYTWEKELPIVKPAYLISLKTYVDDHLLPYLKSNPIPDDGIFTPIPAWMLK